MVNPLPRPLQYVLIVPDGAADNNCDRGGSPLRVAHTPAMDCVAREGVCGLMQTLYADLPRESMVAQLGMLGWDPHKYYPCGRASSELLARAGVRLNDGDIAFRANLVRLRDGVLESYSAHAIDSDRAAVLIRDVSGRLSAAFPGFELYHHSDFRNTLVIRGAGISPRALDCPEPHERHGDWFDLGRLVRAVTDDGLPVARRLNDYLVAAAAILAGREANALFPWSPSGVFRLPSFHETTGFEGQVAVVGFMDFLLGIAKAGGLDSYRVGNGRPDTDYAAKGRRVLALLDEGCACVVCHINAPDEASHGRDLDAKIASLERIDAEIVRPILGFFDDHPAALGGVMILPDHYSNVDTATRPGRRSEIHALTPVPFALWNRRDRDACTAFHEVEAARGRYGAAPRSHLDLLSLLWGRPVARRAGALCP